MKEIKGFIIDKLEHDNRCYKKNLTKNKRALKQPLPTAFTVDIVSSWDDECDSWAKASTLEEAMEQAIKKFKSTNNREDVQGEYFVTVHLQNGISLDLPKKYWGHIQKSQEKK